MQVRNLRREIISHQRDRHEKNCDFGKEDCDAGQALDGVRLFECNQIEILAHMLVLIKYEETSGYEPRIPKPLSRQDTLGSH